MVLALVGIAVGELASPLAGVVLTFFGAMLAFRGFKELNAPATHAVLLGSSLLHGLALWHASGNLLLGVAPVAGALAIVIPATETVARRLSYHSSWQALLAAVLIATIGLSARPYSLWHLALVPAAVPVGLLGTSIGLALVDLGRRARRVRADIGKPFPDFTLPARLGQPEFRLSDHRGRHVLVCLLRGDWCPVCHVMMRIIAKDAPVLAAHGVKVVAVSADEGVKADTFARALGVDYPILIDPGCVVAASLGALHEDAPQKGKNTNLPALFVVDPEGCLVHVATARDLTLHDPKRVIDIIGAKPRATDQVARTS
jgi:peroxiredoxin